MSHQNIAAAIAAVMQDVTAVAKGDQFNGGQTRYAYRGVDRVVTALSASMRKHGLIMLPQATEPPVYAEVTTTGGKAAVRVTVTVTYVLVHTGNGEELRVTVPGEAMDSSDKATAKAMSVAWRTALLQTFFLPTDEPDPDSERIELGQPGFRGASSPANQERLRQYDERAEQTRASWQSAIEEAGNDFEELGRLYLRAQQQKAPADVLARIKELGNAAKPGGK